MINNRLDQRVHPKYRPYDACLDLLEVGWCLREASRCYADTYCAMSAGAAGAQRHKQHTCKAATRQAIPLAGGTH